MTAGLRRAVAQWSVTAAARVAGMVLRLAVAVLVSRLFGPLALGLYVLTLSLTSGAGVVSSLGLEATAARFTAYHLGRDERPLARGVLVFCCAVSAGAGLALAGALFLAAPSLASWLRRPELVDAARLAAAAVLAGAVGAVARAGLTGLGGARPAAFLEQVVSASVAIPTLVVLHAAGWRSPLAGVVALIAGQVVAAVASLATLAVRATPLRAPAAFLPRAWLRFSAPMWLERGLLFLLGSTGYFLVARWRGTSDVALFGAASRVAMLVILPLEAAATILGPMFADLSARDRWDELQRVYARATVALLAAGAGVGVVTLAAGRWALAGFGSGFGAGYSTLVLLVAGQVVSAGTGPCGLMAVMTGHVRARLINVAVGSALAVALSAVAVPRWGAPGAAGAIAVATTVLNVRQLRDVRRLLGLRAYDLRAGAPPPPVAEEAGAIR
jgi:O-antigen/teichoic acid export membrane protein